MMPISRENSREKKIKALLLSAMIGLGGLALAGCGEEESDASLDQETQEPMSTGPMNADSPPTSSSPGDGVTE